MTDDAIIPSLKQSLGKLDAQRKSLETEGEAIISELTAPTGEAGDGPPMGIDTPLVDADGYPRGDVDVYRARDLRGRLVVIKNDRKDLLKRIDATLEQLAVLQNPKKSEEEAKEQALRTKPKPKPKYDAKTGKWVVMNWDGTLAGVEDGEKRSFENLEDGVGTAAASSASATPMEETTNNTLPAFARVDGVADNSPAKEAGLREGDLITRFGSININNHGNLTGLLPVVTAAADAQQAIAVVVSRPVPLSLTKEMVTVQLVPKPWPGRGLIGCHIVPYDHHEENQS